MKKFFISVLSPLSSPFLLILLAFLYYESISEDITGDLGRNGQIVFSKKYHSQPKFEENVQKQFYWCGNNELKKYHYIFMGDSSTRGIYPFYLKKIVNKSTAKYFTSNIKSPEQAFVSLCNSNVDMPPIVILESAERVFVNRLEVLDFDFPSKVVPIAEVDKPDEGKQTEFSTFYKNQLINNHSVRHIQLKDSLFSCPRKEKKLYFYHDDLQFPSEKQIQIAISKLDSLFQFANEKQIKLFYVIAADKYDVYQDFAIDNPYPKKTVLENFSQFESNPFFVNTRSLLHTKAKEGVTDLYYADDTHWSPIGAKIVAEEIAKRMDSLGVFQK